MFIPRILTAPVVLGSIALLFLTGHVRAVDLLGYWNFDDNSNPALAPDLSGNAPGAAFVGAAAFSADAAGYSGTAGDRSLDLGAVGNGARAAVPTGAHLNAAFANNAMAVSFWQLNTGIGNTSSFWVRSPGAGAGARGFQAHVPWGDGQIYFDHAGCCAAGQRTVVAAGQIKVNRWQHFIFQKDASGRKQIWVDGNLVNDQASGANALLAFDGQIAIGAEISGSNGFGGRIDEFAIFDDALTPGEIAALAGGASPASLFLDANDDAATADEDSLLSKVTPAPSTTVGAFANAAGLDLQGNFVYAVNARGPGGFSIGEANFTADTASGVTITSANEIIAWETAPNFGTTPDDDNLETVMHSIRWSGNPGTVNVDLANLNVGDTYKLQLLFLERTSDRGFDVSIEGTLVVDDFSPAVFGQIDVTPALITHTFVAGDPTLNIVLNGAATPFTDKNPVLQGLTLELCESSLLANDSGAAVTLISADATSANGAIVTASGDGTFSYDPTGAAVIQALALGQVLNDTFSYTAFSTAPTGPETSSTGNAGTVLGTGAASLLGSDLTDSDNIHNEGAYNPPTNFGGFDATFSANDEPGFGGGEFSFNVFDNEVGGGGAKWCCNPAGPTTPDGVGLWVAAKFDLPHVLTHFTITSSNDSPLRDPRVWAIEGSNDGANWAPIFSYSNTGAAPFTARNQVILYTATGGRTDLTGGTTHFESSSPYLYFRYFVDSTGSATQHALNELEFFGQPAPTQTATVAIAVNGVNDAPDATDDGTATDENTLITTLTTGGPASLLDNDSDIDNGDTAILEVIGVGGNPLGSHGVTGESVLVTTALGAQLTVNDDGTFSYDPTASSVIQALGPGDSLLDTIPYTVSDGHGPLPPGGVKSDLALWLDASDIDADGSSDLLSDGALITNWQDKSGNGRDASGVLGAPFYVASSAASPAGAPAVGFSVAGGADQLFTSYNFDNLGPNYTIFAVARYSGGANARVVTSKTRNWLFGHHGARDERWYAEGWIQQTGNANSALHYYSGIIGPDVNGNPFDPGADFWKDGVQLANDHQGSNNGAYKPGAIALGAWAGGGESSNAEVAELIIYDRALSNAERLAVEAYLDTKYFGSGQVAGADTAELTVQVSGVNDQPVLVDDNYDTDEDTVKSGEAPLNLHQLDMLGSGNYLVSADGETFEAFVDNDGTNGWLLIGRGRNGWLFDNDPATGQQTADDVNDGLGTAAAFAPAHFRDNIILDLLSEVGADMSDVEIRILRAGDNFGTGDYQEVIWRDFTGNGDVFTWDFDTAGLFTVTQDRRNAPAGLPGATVGVNPGLDTRDQVAGGNDGNRIFTWAWGGHGNQQGFNYGSTVNNGTNNETSYFWEIGNENHAIPYTEVYIRVTSGPAEMPGLLANDSDPEIAGGSAPQVLEIVSAGPATGAESVLPDTEALPGDAPAGVDSAVATSALGASVTVFDDGSFDYDPTSGPLQALQTGVVVVDSLVYVTTDNDPLMPLTNSATAFFTVTGINDAPTLTSPIPDQFIQTSLPTLDLALFPFFEDVDNDDNEQLYTASVNVLTSSGNGPGPLITTQAILSADGILTIDTPCTLIGTAEITVTVEDTGGLTISDTFLVTVQDNIDPVISGAKDMFLNAPAGGTATANFGGITAWDKVDPSPTLVCVPDDSFAFPIGSTEVTCTATDGSGNDTVATFFVHVFAIQMVAGTRVLDVVSLRGDDAPGAGGTAGVPAAAKLLVHYQASLNNNGDILYSAALSDAGTNNLAVFLRSGGSDVALAVRNVPTPGSANYGNFSDLAIGNGASTFQSATSAGAGHFRHDGTVVSNPANAGASAPGTTGEFRVLRKPAITTSGEVLTVSNLRTGVGGITAADDTGLWRSGSAVPIAREGGLSPIPLTDHSQIHPRVVASAAGDQIAFTSYLLEQSGFDGTDNTAIFAGPLGGTLSMIVREGETSPGEPGVEIDTITGESVNSSGAVAFIGNVRGAGITAANNAGIWWSDGTTLRTIAREGAIAPCLPTQDAVFARFKKISNCDDGSVFFYAYLKPAGALPVVNSTNDGTIWRWDAGSGALHLVAREGDVALSTDGSMHGTLLDFDCNDVGGIVYLATFVLDAGDATAKTRDGVWLARDAGDVAPVLVLRRGDNFLIDGLDHEVSNIELDAQVNPGGATGGYGKVINDSGEILLNLSLNRNKSGLFKMAVP